jgi:hypothetical protein
LTLASCYVPNLAADFFLARFLFGFSHAPICKNYRN